MDVVLHCLGLPFNGETIYTSSLGGSETAGYYLARELARRGHRVRVFTTTEKEGRWDGVDYHSCGQPTQAEPFGSKFHRWAAKTPHDVLLVQRQPRAFHFQWASKVNILQLHDLALFRHANDVGEALWNVSAVTTVSGWHADQVSNVYPVPRDCIDVVPNGIDLELYDCAPNEAIHREDTAFKMLYQSRPERGLEHLVRPGGIMERLKDTPAMLYVCAYDCTVEAMVDFYAKLNAWCERLPNVIQLGALTKPQLASVQKACDLLVYPTEFDEVSCISAMEAMAAGLPMLTSRWAALTETCAGASGVQMLPMKSNGADPHVDEDAFVKVIEEHARSFATSAAFDVLGQAQLASAKDFSWAHAASALEAVMVREIRKRSENATAVLKTAIEIADIDAAEDTALAEQTIGDAIFARAVSELRSMYAFKDDPAAYEEHYKKHQGAYYDEHEEKVIGENVTHSSRFMATISAMNEKVAAAKRSGLRILDYGCAHGHYLMPLAKSLSKCELVGVDISGRAIAAAMKWMVRDQLRNVTLVHGGEEALTLHTLCPYPPEATRVIDPDTGQRVYDEAAYQRFDIIFAGEILEHVWDYRGLIEKFRALLKPDGLLVLTTPFGRWEWIGHEAYKVGREHLHHFERQDLHELFAGHTVDVTCAAVGGDDSGLCIGSFVTSVTFNAGVPIGTIDVARKRREFAARETVSACLIVRDGETTLRGCLNSLATHVDEILIGIDENTVDRTELVIDQFREANPWLAVTTLPIASPVETGFDAARNTVHAHASGQWILWLDADELVVDVAALHKYLRPSLINGVHLPQVHYSVKPAEVIGTDHPCRLFRNDGSIRIYGLVHEHAETEPGKGVVQAIMRNDLQFVHVGYVTEDVRRKRYERNMPLLIKDVEKYPTRTLNKFLLIRDLAQGIVFGANPRGWYTEEDHDNAKKAIELYRELMEQDHPAASRLLIDALKYYSVCVECLGEGFEAEVQFKTINPPLTSGSQVKGRFLNSEHFMGLTNRLFKEATKHYGQKYF